MGFILAQANGRVVPKEDVIFGIGSRAQAAIAERGKDNVINATIGMLLDDEGDLRVLTSVDKTFRALSQVDYAQYAPIGGTPGFRAAAIKAAMGKYEPKSSVRAVSTPGGTGAIRLCVSNYTKPGDKILTTDWHWGPYGKIAGELGRSVTTFTLFDDQNKFNVASFDAAVKGLAETQECIMMILNTPAQNPTGYSLTDEDWAAVKATIESLPSDKKIALLIDTAYIDFARDQEKARDFLAVAESMPANVMPMLAFSFSKTFTMYGMRCGALICMAPSEEAADEFVQVAEYSARASWSNCPRAPQAIIEKIYADEALLKKVYDELAEIREQLLERGRAFEKAAEEVGLGMLPYCGGFFAVVPCEDPAAVGAKLEEKGLFTIPFSGRGLRVSLAAVPLARCSEIPAIMLEAIGK